MKIIDIKNKPNSVHFKIEIEDDIIGITLNRKWCEEVGDDNIMEYLKDIVNRKYNNVDDNVNYNMLIGKEL